MCISITFTFGNKKNDPAWPGPVWGFNFKNKLDEKSKQIDQS